ncbi:lipoamide acyltransferase component of branched-chain alpha-keto acid dehydrogenase complex, mitochondrial-like isoform X2 [Bolinopsis microptera]|uniref:lipoamide acyltransferase component of branched-chain alpha-keto acid dehydrogenase complex, mitochondrial-like isoform X2 n=1 Tax=Bolinopsis microptera TaxID=2820187 RepID=UPI00307AB47E
MSAFRRTLQLLPTLQRSYHVQNMSSKCYVAHPATHCPVKRARHTVVSSPVPCPSRDLHTSVPQHNATVVPFKLSDIGEGIAEVTIKEWYVNVGDEVAQFDNICEVQSDKATVTITCRYDGIVRAVHFAEEDICKVGQALVDIEVSDEEAENVLPSNSSSETVPVPIQTQGSATSSATPSATPSAAPPPPPTPATPAPEREILTTPAVRKLAADKKVDLVLVPGSGKGGRITKDDLLNYLASAGSATEQVSQEPLVRREPAPIATIPTAQFWNSSPTSQLMGGGNQSEDTVVDIKGIAKVMVKTMSAAQQVPRFTYHDEYSMDNIVQLKDMIKKLGKEHKIKLTFMPLLIKAASQAMADFPMVNAHVNSDCTAITYKASHNIGIATDTPHGLMVPNIKNVQNLSILDIASELDRLKTLGNNNKLSADDVTGGTFSLSNVGAVGGTYASPMLVVPEVCIGAFGKIQTRPAFNTAGEVYAANTMCVSWSGDHRVLDGATVARYSNTLKRYLENPSLLLFYLK